MRRSGLIALLGAVLLMAAFSLAVLDPFDARLPSMLAAGAVLSLGVFAFLERDLIRRIALGRQARMGSLATAWSLAVLVALGALTFLAERHAIRVDLTASRRHSLSADSLRILDEIPTSGAQVELFGVGVGSSAASQAESNELKRLMDLFAKNSPRVRAQAVNAQLEPALARELGVTRLPSVVVRFQAAGEEAPRVRRSERVDEASIARTIEDALLGKLPLIHFVSGHGELSPVDQGPAGLLFWAEDLRATNHDIREITLVGGGIPEDATLLVFAGPQSDFLEQEIAALKAFSARGGRVLLLLPPLPPDPSQAASQSRLLAWLGEDWGVDAPPALVADLDSIATAGDSTVLVVKPLKVRTHAITRDFRKLVLMPITRPFSIHRDNPVGVAAEAVLSSGPQSWGEVSFTDSPAYDQGVDVPGPLDLVIATTRQPYPQESEARMLLAGSAYMAANGQFAQAGNADFLRNAVDWLSGRELKLEKRKGEGRDGTAVIPARQGRIIMVTSLLVPLIVLAAGAVTWWRRRRL